MKAPTTDTNAGRALRSVATGCRSPCAAAHIPIVFVPFPRTSRPADERAEQLRRQRPNAEPHGQTEPRQDITGTSDIECGTAAGVDIDNALGSGHGRMAMPPRPLSVTTASTAQRNEPDSEQL
jgi:hypothetical protein